MTQLTTSAEVEKQRCIRDMNAIIVNATDEKRNLTDDESKSFDKLCARVDQIKSGWAEDYKFDKPIAQLPTDDNGVVRTQERIHGQQGRVESRKWGEVVTRCGGNPGDWAGFRDADEYLQVLGSQRWDPRLSTRAQGTLIDSEGGFAVPAPLAAGIMDISLESEIIRPRARVFAMTSRTLGINAWSGADHSGSSLFGGITAHWEGEGDTLTADTPKLRKTTLEARKLAFLGRISTELGEDSPNFAQAFRDALTGAAGWHLDDAFLNGEGGSKPEGIRNSPAIVTVAKESGQAAATIVWENIVGMWSRMWAGSRNTSIWVANGDVIPQLYTMSQAIGTAGVPVFEPASQPTATLFGRPILFTEKLPSLGTQGDILLIDPAMYAVGLRAGITLAISPHLYFGTDELAFRLRVRVDGKSLWDKALTPKNGATVSPFVQLAVRA